MPNCIFSIVFLVGHINLSDPMITGRTLCFAAKILHLTMQ